MTLLCFLLHKHNRAGLALYLSTVLESQIVMELFHFVLYWLGQFCALSILYLERAVVAAGFYSNQADATSESTESQTDETGQIRCGFSLTGMKICIHSCSLGIRLGHPYTPTPTINHTKKTAPEVYHNVLSH